MREYDGEVALKKEGSTDTVVARALNRDDRPFTPVTPHTFPHVNSAAAELGSGVFRSKDNLTDEMSLQIPREQISKKDIALSALIFFMYAFPVAFYAFPVAFNFALLSYKRGKGNEELGGLLFAASLFVNLLAAVQLVYRTWARFATVKELYQATVFRHVLEDESAFKKMAALMRDEAPYLISLGLGIVGGAITVAPGIPLSDEGLQVLEFFRQNSGARAIGDGLSAINTFTTRFVGTSVIAYQAYTKWLMRYVQPDRYFLQQALADIKKYPDCLPDDLTDTVSAFHIFYRKLSQRDDRQISSADQHRFLQFAQIACAITSQAIDPVFLALTQKGGNKINDNGWADHPGFVLSGGIANSAFYTLYSYRFPGYAADFFKKFPDILRSAGFQKSVLPLMFMFGALIFSGTMLSGAGYAQAGDEMIQPMTNVTGANRTLMDQYGNFGSVAVDYWMVWANAIYTQFAKPLPFFGTVYGLLCMTIAGLLVNGGMVLGFLLSCADEYKRYENADIKQPFWKVTLEYLFHCFNLAAQLPQEVKDKEALHHALDVGQVRLEDIQLLQKSRDHSTLESAQTPSCWDRVKFWRKPVERRNEEAPLMRAAQNV